MFRAMQRVAPHRLPELMDSPACAPAALHRALDTIARAHRWSGGHRFVWRQVRWLLRGRTPGPITVLDVGAGGGHGAAALTRRLLRHGWRPSLLLADLHPEALWIARNRSAALDLSGGGPRVECVRLTAPRLPLADASVDVAVSSNMLHHLERADAVGFLRELGRVARIGWAVIDLRRSRPLYLAMRAGAVLLPREALPRRDGPVSVRRAFNLREARGLAAEAGAGVRLRPRLSRFGLLRRRDGAVARRRPRRPLPNRSRP